MVANRLGQTCIGDVKCTTGMPQKLYLTVTGGRHPSIKARPAYRLSDRRSRGHRQCSMPSTPLAWFQIAQTRTMCQIDSKRFLSGYTPTGARVSGTIAAMLRAGLKLPHRRALDKPGRSLERSAQLETSDHADHNPEPEPSSLVFLLLDV